MLSVCNSSTGCPLPIRPDCDTFAGCMDAIAHSCRTPTATLALDTHIDPLASIRVLQAYLASYARASWITIGMYQSRSIKVYQPVTVHALAISERALCGWGHYVVIKHMGQRLPPDAYLQPDTLYTVELRKSKHVRPFPHSMPVIGGGTELKHQCLGDQIIWRFMRALCAHAVEDLNMTMPFMLNPFRGTQLLQLDRSTDSVPRGHQEHLSQH